MSEQMPTLSAVFAASTFKSAGYVIAAVIFIGFIVYVFINTRKAKAEVGSELELAPNRKPYYDDAELEGRVLDRALTWGLILLGIIGLGLPLYWLNEPGRQEGAVADFNSKFISRGEALFQPTAAGGLNCAGCHGTEGIGNTAPFTVTDANGDFVEQVQWRAPALNTVLWRYSEDEVTDILVYGRPFSPMPAWGVDGGGPLNEQQISNLVDYLWSIQLTPDQMRSEVQGELDRMTTSDNLDQSDPVALGEALFNLGFDSGFAGGGYSCGRCHTQGWSYTDPNVEFANQDAGADEIPDGSGAFGPNLTNGATERQFPTNEGAPEGESQYQSMIDFITTGSETGKQYGVHGQGSGRMPGFGANPNAPEVIGRLRPDLVDGADATGMLTPTQIEAIVTYERTVIGRDGDPERTSN